jgi:hypothetical protein
MVSAFTAGKSSIADELVFPSPEGSVLDPDNLVKRYFLPAIEHAGCGDSGSTMSAIATEVF